MDDEGQTHRARLVRWTRSTMTILRYQALLTGLLVCLLVAGCADSEEEVCCTCLVDHGCSAASHDRCMEVFHVVDGTDNIAVDGPCVRAADCYLSCAAAGAYFTSDTMVVNSWKKQSVP